MLWRISIRKIMDTILENYYFEYACICVCIGVLCYVNRVQAPSPTQFTYTGDSINNASYWCRLKNKNQTMTISITRMWLWHNINAPKSNVLFENIKHPDNRQYATMILFYENFKRNVCHGRRVILIKKMKLKTNSHKQHQNTKQRIFNNNNKPAHWIWWNVRHAMWQMHLA